MIQWARVSELYDEIGAEDFDEVVELFLEEVEDVIGRLRATPDDSRLEEDLHFLKGSALNLGFKEFSELCQNGETLSANNRAGDVRLSAILDCYDRSKARFSAEYLTRLAP